MGKLFAFFFSTPPHFHGHGRVDSDTSSHGKGNHQELKRVNYRKSRKPRKSVPADKKTVDDIVKCLNQLGKHHWRGKSEKQAADLLAPKKFTCSHEFSREGKYSLFAENDKGESPSPCEGKKYLSQKMKCTSKIRLRYKSYTRKTQICVICVICGLFYSLATNSSV